MSNEKNLRSMQVFSNNRELLQTVMSQLESIYLTDTKFTKQAEVLVGLRKHSDVEFYQKFVFNLNSVAIASKYIDDDLNSDNDWTFIKKHSKYVASGNNYLIKVSVLEGHISAERMLGMDGIPEKFIMRVGQEQWIAVKLPSYA